jgi:hypothetical protein
MNKRRRHYSSEDIGVIKRPPRAQRREHDWVQTWTLGFQHAIRRDSLDQGELDQQIEKLVTRTRSSIKRLAMTNVDTAGIEIRVSVDLRDLTTAVITVCSNDRSIVDELPIFAYPLLLLLEHHLGPIATIQDQPREVWFR